MGNIKSSPTSKPLAIIAVARQVQVQRYQIVVLRDTLARFADSNGTVNHGDYLQALQIANLSSPDSREIFNLLFTMWDSGGNDKIPYRQFALGIAPLACPNDAVASVIRFLLHVYEEKSKTLCADKLLGLLKTVNISASHFGDNQLIQDELMAIVEFVFDKQQKHLSPEECTEKLAMNKYVKRFISGKVRKRVTFNGKLVEIMEVPRIEIEEKPEPTQQNDHSPISVVGSIFRKSFGSFDWDTDTIPYDCTSPMNFSKQTVSTQKPSFFDTMKSWEYTIANFEEKMKEVVEDNRDGSKNSANTITLRVDPKNGYRVIPDNRKMEV